MDRIFNPEHATDDRRFTEGDYELDIVATPMAPEWLNNVQEEICAVIEDAGLSLDPANQTQLLEAIKRLAPSSSHSTQVDVFESSGTFIKPAGAKSIHVLLIGAGQGGASGSVCLPDGSAMGGIGGSGGARLELTLDAGLFPASCAVTVGVGGMGGAASAGAGLPGGGAAATTLIIGSSRYTAVSGNSINSSAVFPGGLGGATTIRGGGLGGNGSGGAPGGGGGAGISAGSAYPGGSSAYSLLHHTTGTVPGGSGGSPPGGAGMDIPTNAQYATYKYPGVSGGGGASRYDTTDGGDGGRGGHGGFYGAGGGGGGATLEGGMSGAGGNGANGVAVITTFF